MDTSGSNLRRITLTDVGEEPFRIFFPAAIFASLLGVALWPLHFGGVMEFYPGPGHARLMTHGFFGGLIFGFLGTALPRMLSAPRFTGLEVGIGYALYLAMMAAHGTGYLTVGDALFLGLLLGFVAAAAVRLVRRQDVPPPGFVLVALAFASAMAGGVISLLMTRFELAVFWALMRPLLYYQGFVLLPILGVGAFILPRFFGMASSHNFPESVGPPPGWINKALLAAAAGVLIVVSFVIEAAGWHRSGAAVRLVTAGAYLLYEIPFYQSRAAGMLGWVIKLAFALFLIGLLSLVFWPVYRVGLLHLTLIGGFGLIALTVATRVVFGHSGNQALLSRNNPWFVVAVVLILVAMATRISGDFWPKIMVSHYNYGALLWGMGVLVWAGYVLPKVFVSEVDED